LKIGRIVIDPGHGGHDTGTIGPTGLHEKELVLDLARRLRQIIGERLGSEVVLTREEDTFIPLEARTALANERQADLFLSIHANASRSKRARGNQRKRAIRFSAAVQRQQKSRAHYPNRVGREKHHYAAREYLGTCIQPLG
ncbi:MAG: N-acetylmuramoyl-L-alanine amidase, partial [Patescibacteria group bacterium]|nr:N-acetylmuramoyl-L-alanine amidase [Patescibacteria group bacterium]